MPSPTRMLEVPVQATEEEVKRLRAAGFQPVVRWITPSPGSQELKTIEALTRLDRIGMACPDCGGTGSRFTGVAPSICSSCMGTCRLTVSSSKP